MKRNIGILLVAMMFGLGNMASAQSELAATLEVLSSGVEVLRANTVNWIEVKVEAIVGVGDTIRTDETGAARITFFADGVDTEILPNTEYRIQRFEGNDEAFNLTVELLAGRTRQQLLRLLDANSSYDVNTPGMVLAARGTQFTVRVEDSGRSAMLVSEGTVEAGADEMSAAVPADFGIRSSDATALSDVVQAGSFEELDAALDGCGGSISLQDDVSLNVRIGPGLDAALLGTIQPAAIDRLFGVYQGEPGSWHRIAFRGGFGWIYANDLVVNAGCAGLRQFDSDRVEDPSLYEALGNPITLDELNVPDSSPESASDSSD